MKCVFVFFIAFQLSLALTTSVQGAAPNRLSEKTECCVNCCVLALCCYVWVDNIQKVTKSGFEFFQDWQRNDSVNQVPDINVKRVVDVPVERPPKTTCQIELEAAQTKKKME